VWELPRPAAVKKGARIHFCTRCSKSFSRTDHLVKHGKAVHGDPKIGCPEADCTKSFSSPSNLRRHILGHLNVTRACLFCGKQLTQKRRAHFASQKCSAPQLAPVSK